MSDATQEAFEKALADVFEGRECQFGHGPRKLLRELYDRGLADAGASPSNKIKIGQPVRSFSDLQVGDVFQNDYLRSSNRCRRVVQRVNSDEIETEYVSTHSGRIVQTVRFERDQFEQFHNYQYIPDPR